MKSTDRSIPRLITCPVPTRPYQTQGTRQEQSAAPPYGFAAIINILFILGNQDLSAKILKDLDVAVPGLTVVKIRRINLERRRGSFENTSLIYQEAMEETADDEARSFYAVRYARFLAKVYWRNFAFFESSRQLCQWIICSVVLHSFPVAKIDLHSLLLLSTSI